MTLSDRRRPGLEPVPSDTAVARSTLVRARGSARFSWSAVIVAVLVGSVLQLTFTMLGMSLGLAAVGPTEGQVMRVSDLPGAALVWWLMTSLVVLAAAGLIAGRLSPDTGPVGSILQGAAVWAIATIIALALTTTAIGGALSGTFSALVGSTRPAPEHRIVLAVKDADTGRAAIVRGMPEGETAGRWAPSPSPSRPDGAPRGEASPVSSGVEALAWWGVLEASRQLQDPQVRQRLRELAVEAWRGSDDLRAEIEAALTAWIDEGGQIADATAAALSGLLQQVLLLDASQARELVGQWRDDIARAVSDVVDRSDGAEGGVVPAGTPVAAVKAEILRRLDDVRAAVAQVIAADGALSARAREDVLATIERALEVSRQRADLILGRWEDRVQALGRQTQSAARTAVRSTAQAGEAGLDAAATAAAWLAVSLLLGLVAASGGAVAGARLRW